MNKLVITALITAVVSWSQTKVSLANQSKDVDLSNALSTRPFRSGTALPPTCGSGEVFYLSTATPGTNLYACTGTNTWTSLSLPPFTGQTDGILSNTGSAATWVQLAGDVAGAPGAQSVRGLQGISVAPGTPSDGQALVFNSGLNRWQPGSGGAVTDWPVTRSSSTNLTIGTGPGVRIGTTYCQVPATPATVAVGSGTGTIFLFVRSTCELVAAHNIVINSCSGCTAVTGTGYEPDSFPLAKWSVTGGVLASLGTSALTPYYVRPLQAGPNIQLTYNQGVTQISAANLTSLHPVRTISSTFDIGGMPLSAGATRYLTVPFACTLSGWNLAVDQGTASMKIWRVPTGTAIPTIANSISTAGIAISTGTAAHSTDMSDFTSVAVAANDIFGFNLSAVTSATFLSITLECDQ